jgi:hypothetical protein
VELKRRGVPSELLLFPGEGHELSRSGRPKHRLARFEHILRWWARWLPTPQNPGPGEAGLAEAALAEPAPAGPAPVGTGPNGPRPVEPDATGEPLSVRAARVDSR